jgi:glycosyltransferase involved in cell wall biosynthesis
VKYLREFGWEPVVYTPQNNEIPVYDGSLEKDIPEGIEIIKRSIWEPYNLYKKFIGVGKEEKLNTGGFISQNKKPGLASKISVFIRGNFFIPDARKFWIKPSVRWLSGYLAENKVDVIVSTGPPHSMHLIAMKLRKKYDIPWAADFRDPWTRIYMYKDLMLTKPADTRHKRLEKKVLQSADLVTTVGEIIEKELVELGAKNTAVVHNGYDEDDFTYRGTTTSPGKFSIVHTGAISSSKNQKMFWNCLGRLVKNNPGFKNDFQFIQAGQADVSVREDIERNGLGEHVTLHDYLPHNQIVRMQKQAAVLLLIISNTPAATGAVTGKIFEYIAAERPVLAIAKKDGEIDRILQRTHAGMLVDFDDDKALEVALEDYYRKYKNNSLQLSNATYQEFSRKNLTSKMAGLFDRLISG